MGHGRMDCQLKTARLIMIFINVIFFLIGATLIGEGVDLLITGRFRNLTELTPYIENLIGTNNRIVSDEILYIILIIPGSILILLGFFGCSGAITQIRYLLYCYSWIIGIVLIFQTIIIISLISFRSKLQEQLRFALRLSIQNIYQGPLERNLQSTTVLWDWIMYHFKCCGIDDKNDFDITENWNRTNPWWNNSLSTENKNFKYPFTCCPMTNSSNRILSCAINGSDIYESSCYKKIFDMIHPIQGFVLLIVLFIVLIEMFALIFVLVMINRNQIRRLSNIMERSPPSYSSRTRMNNTNLYFPI